MMNEKWIAEFTGLFWGEGTADIQKFRKLPKGEFYRPRLRIGLRADDQAVLKDVQEKLGGQLRCDEGMRHDRKVHPSIHWTLTNKDEIVWLTTQMLEHTSMPSKKRKQVELVREAAMLRAGKQGQHIKEGERVRLEEIYNELRAIKRFE